MGERGVRRVLRLGSLGFADALLQALFPAVAFALKFLVPFSFLVSHGLLLVTDDFRVTRVAHTATFVKSRLLPAKHSLKVLVLRRAMRYISLCDNRRNAPGAGGLSRSGF